MNKLVPESGLYQEDRDGVCVCVNRRSVLGGFAAGALLGLSGRAVAQDNPAAMSPQPGDYLVRTSDQTKTPLTPDGIELGSAPFRAWPFDPATDTVRNGALNNLLLVSRWSPEALTAEAMEFQAEGVVAQSAICTHQACDISEWVAEQQVVECPCHYSRFDPKDAGAVVNGPAIRRLPSLTLSVVDGRVVVQAPFNSPVGVVG